MGEYWPGDGTDDVNDYAPTKTPVSSQGGTSTPTSVAGRREGPGPAARVLWMAYPEYVALDVRDNLLISKRLAKAFTWSQNEALSNGNLGTTARNT